MLLAAKATAERLGADAEFLRMDLRSFDLGARTCDFAYVLLGSLYVKSNDEFLDHLRCVARALRSGGLYLLDGVLQFRLLGESKQTWTIRKGGISVKTTYEQEILDSFEQRFREHLRLTVSRSGERKTIETKAVRKMIFPQEFRMLVERQKQFEYVGWFNDFSFVKPEDENTGRRMVVLRRR
jgi:hypothetical protein